MIRIFFFFFFFQFLSSVHFYFRKWSRNSGRAYDSDNSHSPTLSLVTNVEALKNVYLFCFYFFSFSDITTFKFTDARFFPRTTRESRLVFVSCGVIQKCVLPARVCTLRVAWPDRYRTPRGRQEEKPGEGSLARYISRRETDIPLPSRPLDPSFFVGVNGERKVLEIDRVSKPQVAVVPGVPKSFCSRWDQLTIIIYKRVI